VLCITFFLLLLYSFFALIISCAKSMLIGRNFVVLCYLMQFSQDKNGNLILFLKTPSSLYALMHLDITEIKVEIIYRRYAISNLAR